MPINIYRGTCKYCGYVFLPLLSKIKVYLLQPIYQRIRQPLAFNNQRASPLLLYPPNPPSSYLLISYPTHRSYQPNNNKLAQNGSSIHPLHIRRPPRHRRLGLHRPITIHCCPTKHEIVRKFWFRLCGGSGREHPPDYFG